MSGTNVRYHHVGAPVDNTPYEYSLTDACMVLMMLTLEEAHFLILSTETGCGLRIYEK